MNKKITLKPLLIFLAFFYTIVIFLDRVIEIIFKINLKYNFYYQTGTWLLLVFLIPSVLVLLGIFHLLHFTIISKEPLEYRKKQNTESLLIILLGIGIFFLFYR